MTEFTTGVLFLMSSLYGSGQADAHIANIAYASTEPKQVISEILTYEEHWIHKK
jgi:hypothetical protein